MTTSLILTCWLSLASVAPPRPTYRPCLPAGIVSDGLLSDAQLESVIYAGEAHAVHLAGSWTVDATYDSVSACHVVRNRETGAVLRFRCRK